MSKHEWWEWKFAGIYLMRNTHNNKIYVGQSCNIARRIKQHRYPQANGCTYLDNAIRKYSWKVFEISLLEHVDDLSLLNEREQYWLDTLESYNPQKGYNISSTAGSCKGLRRANDILGTSRGCENKYAISRQIYLPANIIVFMDQIATKLHCSYSEIICQAINEYWTEQRCKDEFNKTPPNIRNQIKE